MRYFHPKKHTQGLSIVAIVLVIAAVLIVGGFVAWDLYHKKAKQQNTNTSATTTTVPTTTENNRLPIVLDTKPILGSEDQDGDGLRDELETKYGTDSKKKDTDDDGLNDGEEIAVFRTDPLKKDTDGDGISDGDEIHGYSDPLDAKSVPSGKPLPAPKPETSKLPTGDKAQIQ